VKGLIEIIKDISPKSILVVTGNKSYLKSSFVSELKILKKKYSIQLWRYKKSYPDFKEIEAFIDDNKVNFDLIISYGGGTVIDVSKLISISNNFKSFYEVFDMKKIKISIKHLCIPTTFGSGSESTCFAVLYKDKLKYSIQSPLIMPNDVILNYKYTLSLNGKVSYCSILDSFCQSIESLWSVNNTSESSVYAIKAIKLISKSLNNINLLKDIDRRNLLEASNLSGKAINITKTTAPHAFSYYLTIYHNICHGEAVSIIFEKFIDLNFDYINENNQKKIFKYLNINNKNEFILFFKDLKSKIGFKSSLKEIENLNIDDYSMSINNERLINNPVKVIPKDIIYDSLY
jgi:alcohol dehydrogenase